MRHVTYANVMSTVAVFLALSTGIAWAAPKMSGAAIKNRTIKPVKLVPRSLTAGQMKSRSINNRPLANQAVDTRVLRDGQVTNPDLSSGSVSSRVLASGAVTSAKLATTPSASVRAIGASIPSGVATDVTFTTESHDTNSMWSPSAPTDMDIRTSGTWIVSGVVRWNGGAAGGNRIAMLELNDGDIGTEGMSATIGAAAGQSVTRVLRLSAGDVIRLVVVQAQGSNLILNNAHLDAALLSP